MGNSSKLQLYVCYVTYVLWGTSNTKSDCGTDCHWLTHRTSGIFHVIATSGPTARRCDGSRAPPPPPPPPTGRWLSPGNCRPRRSSTRARRSPPPSLILVSYYARRLVALLTASRQRGNTNWRTLSDPGREGINDQLWGQRYMDSTTHGSTYVLVFASRLYFYLSEDTYLVGRSAFLCSNFMVIDLTSEDIGSSRTINFGTSWATRSIFSSS